MITKEVIEILDMKHKQRVKKETGMYFIGEVPDTARLYQLIPLFLKQCERNEDLEHKMRFIHAKISSSLAKIEE